MKNNQTIGDLHRLQHGYSYDEHEFFYDFLLISPSYYKAHQFVTGRSVHRDVNSNISQWDLVLKTYALCGNVYAIPFVSGAIVQLVPGAVTVQVAPPGDAVTV